MIFVTVGTQLPFPRLVSSIDQISPRLALPVFAQTADPHFQAKHIDCRAFLPPDEYNAKIEQSSLIVAHAGIGTVLQAKTARKPLIIFPRRASLGEHRNEHQLASASFLRDLRGVHVAWTDHDLEELLRQPALEAADPRLGAGAQQLVGFLSATLRNWHAHRP
jgi:UDP-N-acetylglucosamine transferase subunit ALG13